MKCEKCQDKGFTEQEHGLIMVFCDCGKGKELKAQVTGEIPEFDGGHVLPSNNMMLGENEPIIPLGEMAEKEGLTCLADEKGKFHYDSSSRTGQTDNSTGSPDTSQSKQPRKSAKRKGTTKRPRKTV